MTINRILLVEDDPDQLQALKIMIAALFPSAQILAAPDGYNALAMATPFRPDAIISDVGLPQANGLSFLHALLPTLTPQPKVLVLTAFDRQQLQRVGPLPAQAQFLQKPITPEQLSAAIADWF
ncbi:response regulator [Permianibacter sp. IMCC34836]|uniref:response regulator n=1 Tax=Permianibacter fluminis TaxID=2738515 RepID=UPI001552A6D1|nr:response regulator [Permianibacter fluminis]NQD36028.1 response regulator [Permianibacter fluminis]